MTTIHVTLSPVEVEPRTRPEQCPECGHWRLHRHGVVRKPIRDQQVHEVTVHRYRCAGCGHSFRHYPVGVTRAAHSQRLVGSLALCWALGLSLRRSALLLCLVGITTSYVSVWRAVQTVGSVVRRPARGAVTVLGVDGTGMRLAGQRRGVVVAVDLGSGALLELGLRDERDPQALAAWLQPLVRRYGVEVLVTDDLGSYTVAAAQLGLARQGCRFHLARWVGRRLRELESDLGPEHRLVLTTVRTIVERLDADGDRQLVALWQSLGRHPHPRAGPRSAEVRLWRLVGWLSERWASYRLCVHRADVPATNNRTEQAIGRLKMRSRTVRGYKSDAGLLNGSAVAGLVGTGRDLDLQRLLTATY